MPDIWFDVDAALSEVPVNIFPLTDDTDFKAIEDAVVYNAAGMALRWHFVTTSGAYTVTSVTPTSGGNYDWTDQGDSGIYTIEIPASGGASINNDTEGFGWFTGKATGVLPWRSPIFGFRAAALNNALVDGSTLDVNVATMAADSLTASAVKADAVTELQAGLASQSSVDIIDDIVDTLLSRLLGTIAPGTHQPQSGDAYARLGTPEGASIAADIATLSGVVTEGIPHYYAPDATSAIVTGSILGGTYATLAARDDNLLTLAEVAGGLEYIAEFSGIEAGHILSELSVTGRYSGNAIGHQINVSIWNYATSAWIQKFIMLDRATNFDYAAGLTADNVSGGLARVRFQHSAGTGQTSHRLYLDRVQLTAVEATNESAAQISAILSMTYDIDNEVGELHEAALGAGINVAVNNDKTGYSGEATNMVSEPDNAGISAAAAAAGAAQLAAEAAENAVGNVLTAVEAAQDAAEAAQVAAEAAQASADLANRIAPATPTDVENAAAEIIAAIPDIPPVDTGTTITQATRTDVNGNIVAAPAGTAIGQVQPYAKVTVYRAGVAEYEFDADADGDFSYILPDGGTWTLVARRTGYKDTSITIVT